MGQKFRDWCLGILAAGIVIGFLLVFQDFIKPSGAVDQFGNPVYEADKTAIAGFGQGLFVLALVFLALVALVAVLALIGWIAYQRRQGGADRETLLRQMLAQSQGQNERQWADRKHERELTHASFARAFDAYALRKADQYHLTIELAVPIKDALLGGMRLIEERGQEVVRIPGESGVYLPEECGIPSTALGFVRDSQQELDTLLKQAKVGQ